MLLKVNKVKGRGNKPKEVNMNNTIKQARNKRGLTQKNLADIVGISEKWLSKIESGKQNPTVSLAIRIADALGVKVDDIFYN